MKISKNILNAYIQDTQQMLEGWRYNMQTYAAKPKANQAVIDIASKRAATVKRLIEAVQTYIKGGTNTFIYGEPLPQAQPFEEAILGAILMSAPSLETVDFLTPEDFYSEANRAIFQAFREMKNQNKTIDMIMVVEHLRATNELTTIGGAYYITELTNRVASAANIEAHARVLQQKTIRRKAIFFANKLTKMAYDPSVDCFEIPEAIEAISKTIDPRQKEKVNV